MMEDKLSQDQRLRLEALNQSVQSFIGKQDLRGAKGILDRARVFEVYIRKGKNIEEELT